MSVLKVNSVSKKYHINNQEFFALKDISFELNKGETLGIIGGNGAGKSTLLKVLAEVISPSSGEVEYNSKLLSILEIGTGFHPDLSGYENIFFNAALLGMKKHEIEREIPAIIEFSGVEKFINEPVKNYSSGMYLRLALSVALHTDFSIILLDEVISVGDIEFRLKAMKKLKEEISKGKSCILISHDMNSITSICNKCMILDKGAIIFSGSAHDAVNTYLELSEKKAHENTSLVLSKKLVLNNVRVEKEICFTDEAVKILIQYDLKEPEIVNVILKIRLYTGPLLQDSFAFRADYIPEKKAPGKYETECIIPANLLNKGKYIIDVIIGNQEEVYTEVVLATKFTIQYREWEENKNWNSSETVYPIKAHCTWNTKPL